MTLLYKNFLRLIGILPFEGRDLNHPGSQLLLGYYLASSCVHWSMFLFYLINGKKVPAVDTICEIILVMGTVVRYYLLVQHRRKFAELLNECRAIWDVCDEDGRFAVRQFELKVRRLFKLLLGSCCFINVMYSASAAIATINAARLNETHERYLPSKWYTEDGANLWPGYKINFVLQVLVIQNSVIIGTSVDTAAPLLIMIGAGYFRALRQRFLSIVHGESSNADFELVACAKLHQRILKFCSKIDEITGSLFFVQLMGTVYNISLAGFKLAGTDPDRYKFLPISMYQLGGLFICQWAPDHLIDESTALATVAYSVSFNWMRRRFGKLFVIIIARSQRPVQMTAAGVVNLSLEKFGSMLTSAASFFTVLRNSNA